jgi:CDP-diacylglycerol---serine O-phosphatidyltransferase
MKLPDYVTCLNLISGLLSIFSAVHGRYSIAALLLLAGVLFDMLDGYLARKLKQESDFGAELDSLSDLVTFGVAPMVLIMSYYPNDLLSLLAILIPVCGALRLARHNINRHLTKGYLIGLPITFSGITIPLLILANLGETIAFITIAGLCAFYISTHRVNKIL